jgi:hypothetical protein
MVVGVASWIVEYQSHIRPMKRERLRWGEILQVGGETSKNRAE